MKDSLQWWTDEAARVVAGKVADASAHAGRAVTKALKAADDGRPTLRRAAQSPSLAAAQSRLDELTTALAGPSRSSTDGLLRTAREVFYRTSFARWARDVPEPLRVRANPKPTAAHLAKARGFPIHGVELRDQVKGAVDGVSRRLNAAVVQAGSRTVGKRSVDPLDAWERAARETLTRVAALALSDAWIAIDREAGRDVVHPDFLDDSPIEVD